jgi:outer membrane receptor protein involved in Fe transport
MTLLSPGQSLPEVPHDLSVGRAPGRRRNVRPVRGASGTTIRVGARNITDEQPPLTSEGYLGSLYRPYGRYWYVNVSKTF